MIIGAIADIHGNVPALVATLAEMPKTDVTLLAGDIAGRAHELVEVMEIVERHDMIYVQGNHEEAAINYWSLFGGDRRLTEAVGRIQETPHRKELVLDGKRLLVAHGSPDNPKKEYVYPEYPYFNRLFSLGFDYLVLGHTHVPMVITRGRVVIVNPGSVGEPDARDPRPSFAILDTDAGTAEIHHLRHYVETKRLRFITPFRWSRYSVGRWTGTHPA
jgi:putative phosphoesterase